MGHDLYVEGRAPGGGILKKGKSGQQVLNEIAALADAQWSDELFTRSDVLHDPQSGKSALTLMFTPREQLEFRADKKGKILVQDRWNYAGPGYLSRCVSALREIERASGVTWTSIEAECDVKGWPSHADAQATAKGWLAMLLHSMAQSLREQKDPLRDAAIAVELEQMPAVEGAVVTPMGPRSRDWFEAGVQDVNGALDFFPWWDEGYTPQACLGLALLSMWGTIAWVPPRGKIEFSRMVWTARMLERAYRADPSRGYPWAEWHQLNRLIDAGVGSGLGKAPQLRFREAVASKASEAGEPSIGYRRGEYNFRLPGGWVFRLPGAFMTRTDEGNAWTATNGDVLFRAAVMRVPSSAPSYEEIARMSGEEFPPADMWSRERMIGHAMPGQETDEGQTLIEFRCFGKGSVVSGEVVYGDGLERAQALDYVKRISAPRS